MELGTPSFPPLPLPTDSVLPRCHLSNVWNTELTMRGPPEAPTTARSCPPLVTMMGDILLSGFLPALAPTHEMPHRTAVYRVWGYMHIPYIPIPLPPTQTFLQVLTVQLVT